MNRLDLGDIAALLLYGVIGLLVLLASGLGYLVGWLVNRR